MEAENQQMPPLDRLESMLRAWDEFDAYLRASARERITRWRAAPRPPALTRPEVERLNRLARRRQA